MGFLLNRKIKKLQSGVLVNESVDNYSIYNIDFSFLYLATLTSNNLNDQVTSVVICNKTNIRIMENGHEYFIAVNHAGNLPFCQFVF